MSKIINEISIIINGVRYDAVCVNKDLSHPSCCNVCDIGSFCIQGDTCLCYTFDIDNNFVFKKSDKSLSHNKDKCCGNCKHFQNESATGNGWTEITPDNVHEVYEKRGNIAFMNPTLCDYATIWHNVEKKILELYALRGGYYYYVLPELKLED